ncbi:signal peptidase II [Segnochrobactraceae bacterium EtOH-i3]
MSPRLLGLLVAVVVFAADQASKLWILHGLVVSVGDVIPVTPFLNLVLVWNRGISYGLMQQEADLGRWGLVVLTAAAVVLLSVWLSRTRGWLAASAVGLVLGGAAGNLVDRVVYGAVVDFVHLHAGDVSWYVFNIADAAIVAGVIGLLWDSFRPRPRSDAAKKPH